MSVEYLRLVFALSLLTAALCACTGDHRVGPKTDVREGDQGMSDAGSRSDAETEDGGDSSDGGPDSGDAGFRGEIPADTEFLELSFDDGDVFSVEADVFAVGFPVSVTVHGVDAGGDRLDLTGHPDLNWNVAPGDIVELDAAQSTLAGLRTGEAQISVEAPREDGEVVSASENLQFDEATVTSALARTYEIRNESSPRDEYNLQTIEGWDLTLEVLLYAEVGARSMAVPVTPETLEITSNGDLVEVATTGDAWELRPLTAGTAELLLTYDGTGDQTHYEDSVGVDVYERESVESMEVSLSSARPAVAVGEEAQLSSQLRVNLTSPAPPQLQWAVAGQILDWEMPDEILGPIDCRPPGNRYSCRAASTDVGEGTVRVEGTFGGETLNASTSIVVFDPTAIDHISLDPPNLTIGEGEFVCLDDWALSVHRTDGTSEQLDWQDPELIVEEQDGGGWIPLFDTCWTGPPAEPVTIRVTYRTHSVTGDITS